MPGGKPDLRDLLRHLGRSVLGMLRVRGELFAIELEEEKERLQTALILAAVAAIFLGLGMQILAFLVIVIFWDTPYRLHAIVGVGVFYLLVSAWALLRIRRLWRRGGPPFATTVEELRKDFEAMRGNDEP